MGRILDNVSKQWRATSPTRLVGWRVPAALIFSAALVVAAYQLASGIGNPPAALASEEAALLAAIATKDTDADGLPDWEEVLYGTDPRVVDTRQLGMTDGEAVAKGLIVPKAIANIAAASSTPGVSPGYGLPSAAAEGTLTDAFAKQFFTFYLEARAAKGDNLTEGDLKAIEQKTLDALKNAVIAAPDFKRRSDLKLVGSGEGALRTYAAEAEAVLLSNKNTAKKSEIAYLSDAVQNEDTSAYAHIESIAASYRVSAAGLAALATPDVIADDALMLINALARIAEINNDFKKYPTDPLVSILALGQYPGAVSALGTAFQNIHEAYARNGIHLSIGEKGAGFVNLITEVLPPPQTP